MGPEHSLTSSSTARPLPLPQRLLEAFAAAAEAVKEQAMPVEDRVAKWIKKWMKVRGDGLGRTRSTYLVAMLLGKKAG